MRSSRLSPYRCPLDKREISVGHSQRGGITVVELVVALVILCFVLALLGVMFLAETLLRMGFGWLLYLWRTIPEMTIVWPDIALGMILLTALVAGLHAFLWSFAREISARNGRNGKNDSLWPVRRTLALVASVIIMFVAGISAVGLTHECIWFFSMKEPILESNSYAFLRGQSHQHLKQVGIACLNYHDAQSTFPVGAIINSEGRPLHGWGTLILPYLEQKAVYEQIDLQSAWNHPRNRSVFQAPITGYLNPGIIRKTRAIEVDFDPEGFALSHYAANQHVLSARSGLKSDDVTDGAAETILAGEVIDRFKPWGHPLNWRDPTKGINTSPDGFGGPWEYGANMLMMDGSVHFLSNDTDPAVLRALSTPAGGDRVEDFSY